MASRNLEESIVTKRLQAANAKSKEKALKGIKGYGSAKYTYQAIKGAKEGFTNKPDFGLGKKSGAAIPYQIGKYTGTASKPNPEQRKSAQKAAIARRLATTRAKEKNTPPPTAPTQRKSLNRK